jgi:CBS domain-containing protein
MGEQNIARGSDAQLREFTRALLDDVEALGQLLETDLIERNVRRIGAEQELFLVDSSWGPSPRGPEVLGGLEDPRFTAELGRFNLEANLLPMEFGGDCLRRMENELLELLGLAQDVASRHAARVLLVGILPTLNRSHLGLDWMTPKPRYYELNRTLKRLRGGEFRADIEGRDALKLTHNNIMLEAFNTSFQLHFQVGPGEFAELYNLAQVVTAPVLAGAVNSPLLLNQRLWHETRIALFQQSVDVRSKAHEARGQPMRVNFGDRWVDDSVLEVFREDIARFRVVIATELGESSTSKLARGVPPDLKALCLHNGTVYRWNRPCYGVKDGIAHLRIENRVLPAGPTVIDEVANAAFYFGLLSGLSRVYSDVRDNISFAKARENFTAAARTGLQARFHWLDGSMASADDLIVQELIPVAREGLEAHGVDSADIDRYLGVIEERAQAGKTGASWMLDSLEGMDEGSRDEQVRAITAQIAVNQATDRPVHTWDLAELKTAPKWEESWRFVSQIMHTELVTVSPDDIVELAASMMDWERIRHLPVEDSEGHLVGIVTHRAMVRLLAKRDRAAKEITVREVMTANPISVGPECSTLRAVDLMREHRVGCLPVLREGRLAGIVTERDFLRIAGKLMSEKLRDRENG